MRRMDDVRKRRIVQKKRSRITICSVGGLHGVACEANTTAWHFEGAAKGVHPTKEAMRRQNCEGRGAAFLCDFEKEKDKCQKECIPRPPENLQRSAGSLHPRPKRPSRR